MTHGTETGYRYGCRCGECREAARLGRARRRRGEGPGIAVGLQSHGISGYRRHRCRCDVCRAANTEQMRRYVARKRERMTA